METLTLILALASATPCPPHKVHVEGVCVEDMVGHPRRLHMFEGACPEGFSPVLINEALKRLIGSFVVCKIATEPAGEYTPAGPAEPTPTPEPNPGLKSETGATGGGLFDSLFGSSE